MDYFASRMRYALDHMNPQGYEVGGTQSIERALDLLSRVGRAGPDGCRLVNIVAGTGLTKPTARRLLLALIRAGFLDQDQETRRYRIGAEAYVLGMQASTRFGIHALSQEGLVRLADETGDTAFLSIPRGHSALCIHREEGSFPIRSHVLQAGDRHPLGVGAGSLAMLAALSDDLVEEALAVNREVLSERYPTISFALLRDMVRRTRDDGFAVNPGLVMPGSWGVGIAVLDADGRPVGALSIAAIEARLNDQRRLGIARLLSREASQLSLQLHKQGAPSSHRVSHRSHAGEKSRLISGQK
jgi:DNA-binding IclR family transcriptional regulator